MSKKDRNFIAYLEHSGTVKDTITLEADTHREAIRKAEKIFEEKYPEITDDGYTVAVEKGVMTSNSVEPDYYGMTE